MHIDRTLFGSKEQLHKHRQTIEASNDDFVSKKLKIIHFYESKVEAICEHLIHNNTISTKVAISAIIFHKRYHCLCPGIGESMIHLKHIMIACIFLALKCEDVRFSLKQMTKTIPLLDEKLLLKCEDDILAIISYHLAWQTESPKIQLYALWMLKKLTVEEYWKAEAHLMQLYLTDLPLLNTSEEIVLMALDIANGKLQLPSMDTVITKEELQNIYD